MYFLYLVNYEIKYLEDIIMNKKIEISSQISKDENQKEE